MLALLREKLFNKHYKKLIHSRHEKSRKPSVNTISSVTILAPAKNQTNESLALTAHYFQRMGMVCHIYLVKEKNDQLDFTSDMNLILEEECQWFGVPSQEVLIDWLSYKTDLLIVSNPNQKLLIKYLSAASNSKLKTSVTYQGKEMKDIDIDFCVDVPQKELLPLIDQCQLIYSNLTKIGMRPPVIG